MVGGEPSRLFSGGYVAAVLAGADDEGARPVLETDPGVEPFGGAFLDGWAVDIGRVGEGAGEPEEGG